MSFLRSGMFCRKIVPRLVAKKGVVQCRLEMEPDREGRAAATGADVAWGWDMAEESAFAHKDDRRRLRRSQ